MSFKEHFLAIDWLAKKFFSFIDADTFYTILIRLLLEHSVIFVSESIQTLTAVVLGFSYLIQPFKWPFIIIPNLPIDMMNMIESPVPYLIGILGGAELKKTLQKTNLPCEIVYITNNKFEISVRYISYIIFSNCKRLNLQNLI